MNWCSFREGNNALTRTERQTIYRCVVVSQFNEASSISLREYTGLFISPSGISELDCAKTKTDTAERSVSISRESLQVFFLY